MNLKLIPCDVEILTAAIKGNEFIAKKLNVIVDDQWTEFGIAPLQYACNKLSESEAEKGWFTYLPIHLKDNKLVGSGGYNGSPSAEGTVEIGYEIATTYRNRGLATEMAKGLILNAFKDQRVKSIIAHTLCEENPSTSILKRFGFEKIQEIIDPDDGRIWEWELKRQDHLNLLC